MKESAGYMVSRLRANARKAFLILFRYAPHYGMIMHNRPLRKMP